jgi:hypothetical protein
MRIQTSALVVAAVLSFAAFSVKAQDQAIEKSHKLSPSEVKTLIKNASMPEDHLRLAEYFRQEADEEATAAKLHNEMAETYASRPLPSGLPSADTPTVAEMKSHCREFASNAGRASAIAARMAADHEKLARLMQSAPAGTVHRPR